MNYRIGDRVFVRDDGEFFEAEVVKVFEESREACVTYETDYYFKEKLVAFEELDEAHDLMMETASWF